MMVISLPPTKVRFVVGFLMICAAVTVENITVILINFLLAQILLRVYHIPYRFQWEKLKPLLFFFLFVGIFFPLTMGFQGFLKAAIYSGRLIFVAQILAYILYKTSNQEFLRSLYQLKIPTIFIEMIHFTLRFMDVFVAEIKRMKLSLKSKGFFIGKWFNYKKYAVLGSLLGSMLRRSIQRSERIYLGMRSRGFTESIIQYEHEQISVRYWLHTAPWFITMVVIQILTKIWGKG
ncbi:energy-coupling factor transporter transmembrane component T family protein [Neobacillus sp. LXY-4]|uniref:energy-coupling factor transporter transmembrane component T family protein n=1 Tax=Neobacillus sp. LXY-4 TaxID=3379826 RepID=UPI003EE2B570